MGGILVHTNHYLNRRMARLENNSHPLIGSRVRYSPRAARLLRRSRHHTLDTLQGILRDHVNHPNSICSHEAIDENPLDQQKTVCSLIVDLNEKQMHAAWDIPCENDYFSCRLPK